MKKSLIGLFAIVLFVLSCSKEDTPKENYDLYTFPIASFTYTGNDGPAPVVIQFENYSETINQDSTHYLWTFGYNGPESTEKNPTHTFHNNTSSARTLQITMTVFDEISDKSQTRSIPITILPAD